MRCIIALGLLAVLCSPATIHAQKPRVAPAKNNTWLGRQIRTAPLRIATANDVRQLQLFIAMLYLTDGEMPTAAAIRATVKKDAPKLAQLIEDGAIVLTGAKNRNEVWAYEYNAPHEGGWVATSEGVQKMTAAEARMALGK